MNSAVWRVVVGITGASGSIYGIRLLEVLSQRDDVESHLVVSKAGALTLQQETDYEVEEVRKLADVAHSVGNVGATIASGSFPVAGMIVAPCSIKTLSAIAQSYTDDLLSRAADVTLKEGRPLLLLLRESPLHLGHLRLMTQATEAGAVVAPPVPAFYQRPTTLEEMIDHTVRRAIDRLGLPEAGQRPWTGLATD